MENLWSSLRNCQEISVRNQNKGTTDSNYFYIYPFGYSLYFLI